MADRTTYLKEHYPQMIDMCKHFGIPIKTVQICPRPHLEINFTKPLRTVERTSVVAN